MTPRDILILCSRVFLIFSISIVLLGFLTSDLQITIEYFQGRRSYEENIILTSFIYKVITLISYLILLIKTPKIIDKLKLGSGFDNHIIHLDQVGKNNFYGIVVVCFGLWLIFSNIYSLVFNVLNLLNPDSSLTFDFYSIIASSISIIIGFIVIRINNKIARLLIGN